MFPASSTNYGERSADLDLLYRGRQRNAGARASFAALWGQGQEALMPQIMQRSLGVTTSGHLSNRQVIRRSQPQFSIIRASCITLPGSKGKRLFQDLGRISAPP